MEIAIFSVVLVSSLATFEVGFDSDMHSERNLTLRLAALTYTQKSVQ